MISHTGETGMELIWNNRIRYLRNWMLHNAWNKRVSPVLSGNIDYLFLILLLHVFQFSHNSARQETNLSSETSQHSLADYSLQLDVANKAHNKRVSPVIRGCIWFTCVFVSRSAWGPNLIFRSNAQEATTHWLVACQHSLADSSLQLDVANKAHNKRVSPVIPGCIS